MPTGRLPDVDRLAGALNDELARRGRPDRLTADELDRELRGRWPRLASADGVVLHVGSGTGLPPSCGSGWPWPARSSCRPARCGTASRSSGHFPQGGRTVSVAVNRCRGGGLGGSVADFMRPYTEGARRRRPWRRRSSWWAAIWCSSWAGGSGSGAAGSPAAAALALRGEVDDNRGESTFFDVAARWEVDLAPTPAGWTPVGSAEAAKSWAAEPASVRLKVPHPYTEPAAAG